MIKEKGKEIVRAKKVIGVATIDSLGEAIYFKAKKMEIMIQILDLKNE